MAKKLNDLPRTLLNRNPKSQLDIATAIAIINEIGQAYIMQGTFNELDKMGLKNATVGMKVVKSKPKRPYVIIGGFYFFDEGLYFPDSLITSCVDCHIALQIRPRSSKGGEKLCCFCAVDRILKHYWQEQAKLTKKAK